MANSHHQGIHTLADRVATYDRIQAGMQNDYQKPNIRLFAGNARRRRRNAQRQTTPMDIAKQISNSLAKKCVVAEVLYTGERYEQEKICTVDAVADDDSAAEIAQDTNGELYDLLRPLEGDCKLRLLTFEDDLGKMVFWHSSAHVLGQSIESKFGGHLTIGPPIKGGFYYDCYCGSEVCTEDSWFSKLDHQIKKIVSKSNLFSD